MIVTCRILRFTYPLKTALQTTTPRIMATSILGLVAQPQSIAVLLFSTVLLALIHKRLSRHAGLPLPPGPPAESWIFGNSIPKALCALWSFVTFVQTPNDQSSAYRKFETWTREYGPVFSLRQGLNTLIIVGRYHAAVEIMEKGGASTVDRPTSIAAGETLSGGMRVLLTPAGERFKKMRRYVFPSFCWFCRRLRRCILSQRPRRFSLI